MNKLTNILEKNIKWLLLLFSFICFLTITEDVFTHEIMIYDVVGYNIIYKYIINENLTPIMKCITWFGSVTALIIITLLLFILIKNKRISIFFSCNLIIVAILNQFLKFIVQRPRPTEYRIINENGYSFPSGHSMISMAFYGYLMYLIYKHINSKILKWVLIITLGILIILIGFSRIYLGVHYVSDILAGFVVSIGYLILFISITNKFIYKK